MENKITNDGLKHLAELKELNHLDLSWNQQIMGSAPRSPRQRPIGMDRRKITNSPSACSRTSPCHWDHR
jgi:hypothetical protein